MSYYSLEALGKHVDIFEFFIHNIALLLNNLVSMQLQPKEQLIKIFYHHPFPFIVQIVKVVSASLPFFFMLYLISSALSYNAIIIANLIIIAIFSLVILYVSLIYWLDKLIITDKRVIHVDWILVSKRVESEALLYDIQDITTQEKGLLSAIPLFDYGIIRMETASSKTTVKFTEAPDPEGIKAFVIQYIEACRPNATCETPIKASPQPAVES